MRIFYTYLFVVLYVVALIRPIVPLLDYGLNYEYIAEVLCINTDKPELECNGKCYLTQEIQKTFLHEVTDDASVVSIIEISVDRFTIAFKNTINYTVFVIDSFKKVKIYSANFGKIQDYIPPILQPPEFLI